LRAKCRTVAAPSPDEPPDTIATVLLNILPAINQKMG
jgi:hypothetical protein